jgi:RimJ/RimL family protein N-acetyltransferase
MLYGLLVDLVPYDERFFSREAAWINGPMGEWWGQDGLLTETAQQRHRAEREAQPGRSTFGLQTKDGVPIGMFGLFNHSPSNRYAEVGAGIGDPAYWGGGFGSDAMLLIVDYAFNWLDLRRLWLTTAEHNLRAQHQIEKCGFTREALYRRRLWGTDGVHRDQLCYGLLREEWLGRDVLVARLGLREKAAARGYDTGRI